jgi:hypothetical protein
MLQEDIEFGKGKEGIHPHRPFKIICDVQGAKNVCHQCFTDDCLVKEATAMMNSFHRSRFEKQARIVTNKMRTIIANQEHASPNSEEETTRISHLRAVRIWIPQLQAMRNGFFQMPCSSAYEVTER